MLVTGTVSPSLYVYVPVHLNYIYSQVREELQLQKSGEKIKVSKWELIKVVWLTSLSGALIYFGDVAVVTSLTYMPSSDGKVLFVLVSAHLRLLNFFILLVLMKR